MIKIEMSISELIESCSRQPLFYERLPKEEQDKEENRQYFIDVFSDFLYYHYQQGSYTPDGGYFEYESEFLEDVYSDFITVLKGFKSISDDLFKSIFCLLGQKCLDYIHFNDRQRKWVITGGGKSISNYYNSILDSKALNLTLSEKAYLINKHYKKQKKDYDEKFEKGLYKGSFFNFQSHSLNFSLRFLKDNHPILSYFVLKNGMTSVADGYAKNTYKPLKNHIANYWFLFSLDIRLKDLSWGILEMPLYSELVGTKKATKDSLIKAIKYYMRNLIIYNSIIHYSDRKPEKTLSSYKDMEELLSEVWDCHSISNRSDNFMFKTNDVVKLKYNLEKDFGVKLDKEFDKLLFSFYEKMKSNKKVYLQYTCKISPFSDNTTLFLTS